MCQTEICYNWSEDAVKGVHSGRGDSDVRDSQFDLVYNPWLLPKFDELHEFLRGKRQNACLALHAAGSNVYEMVNLLY